MKTVVIGSGSWGTALAQVLADNNEEVILYGVQDEEVNDINQNHKNSKYFPDVVLNEKLKATTDMNVVKDADVVLLAVPTTAIASVAKNVSDLLDKKAIVVSVAKGFGPNEERMSDLIRNAMDPQKISSVVSLIGPSHAEEVVERQLTSIDAVSVNEMPRPFRICFPTIICASIPEQMKLVQSLVPQ